MREIIRPFVSPGEMNAGNLTAQFCFPESFSGFDGHFPGQPVLPGVCLIQSVLVAAERTLGKQLNLAEIVLSKFFAVTLPDQKLDAAIKIDGETVRAKISRDGDRIADIRLRVEYA
jgi:3-hydroxymyristoyl/3-hydroxydecanoyl-(acyl carrier protein) dehydratase